MVKQIGSVLLAALMAGQVAVLPYNVIAAEPTKTVVQINPTVKSNMYLYGGKMYLTPGKELYEQYRDNLVQRNTSFTLNVALNQQYGGYKNFNLLYEDLLFNAIDDQLSASPTDGDYLKYQLNQTTGSVKMVRYEGRYYGQFTIKADYKDTAKEEQQVKSAVNSFVKSLKAKHLSDYDNLKAIHDYVLKINTYDYDAAKNHNRSYAYSAAGPFVYHKSVCQGYALAIHRLNEEMGYNDRIVNSDTHAWNIVKLNGKYYNIDATWDDTYNDAGQTNNKYRYFLKSDRDMCDTKTAKEMHTRTEVFTGGYFAKTYGNNMSTKSYSKPSIAKANVKLSSTSYEYNNKSKTPGVTVKLGKTTLRKGKDYKVSYSNNKKIGTASVTITGIGNYSGKITKTFTIRPSDGEFTMSKMPFKAGNGYTTVYWLRDKNVTGYIVEKKSGGKWKAVKTITNNKTTNYKINGVATGGQATVRIKKYKTVNGKKYYGDPLYMTGGTYPKTAAFSSVSAGKGTANIKWKKTSTFSGVEIKYGYGNSFKTIKSDSNQIYGVKLSGLKRHKKYTVKIRQYNLVKNGSSWSYLYSGWITKTFTTK